MTCPRCPTCGDSRTQVESLSLLASCNACDTRFVPEGTDEVSLVGDGPDGGPILRGRIRLTPEFRREYRLGRVLGRGAAGMVVAATQVSVDRPVAIKFLDRLGDPGSLARFTREGRLLASITHAGVVRIFDVGQLGEHPYMVLELVGGGTLRGRLERERRLDWGEAAGLVADVLEGLQACHEVGVIHRDVKPANVLLDAAGRPKISDLGIAKVYGESVWATRAGLVVGTPIYMSPEQARGDAVGCASDIYAAGVVLYEALAGRPPFWGASAMEILSMHIHLAPPPVGGLMSGLPPELDRLVARALAKPIADRPASAADFARELRRIEAARRQRHDGTDATSASVRSRPGRDVEPRRGPDEINAGRVPPTKVHALAGGLVAVAAILLALGWGLTPPPPPPPSLVRCAAGPEERRARVTAVSSPACLTQVEYWPAADPSRRSATDWTRGPDTIHRHDLEPLEPGTLYRYRIRLARAAGDARPGVMSAIGHFTTVPIIEILEPAAQATPTRSYLDWRTTIPTDTAVRYGEDRLEHRRTNPAQSSSKDHRVTLHELVPGRTTMWRIEARDPAGRARDVLGPSLTFVVPSPRPTASPAGAPADPRQTLGEARAYLRKLAGHSASERERWRRGISLMAQDARLEDPSLVPILALSETPAANPSAFWFRLSGLRRSLGREMARPLVARLWREHLLNPPRARARLDRWLAGLRSGAAPDLEGRVSLGAREGERREDSPGSEAPIARMDPQEALDQGEDLLEESLEAIAGGKTVADEVLARAISLLGRPEGAAVGRPRSTALLGRAHLHRSLDLGDARAAATLLNVALAARRHPVWLVAAGRARGLLGRVDEEIRLYEEALARLPDWIEALVALAVALDGSGREDRIARAPDVLLHASRLERLGAEVLMPFVYHSETGRRWALAQMEFVERLGAGPASDELVERYAGRLAASGAYVRLLGESFRLSCRAGETAAGRGADASWAIVALLIAMLVGRRISRARARRAFGINQSPAGLDLGRMAGPAGRGWRPPSIPTVVDPPCWPCLPTMRRWASESGPT